MEGAGKIVSFFFLFLLVTSRNAQALLRALCSGITPGRAWGSLYDSGIKSGSANCKANSKPAITLLSPESYYFFIDGTPNPGFQALIASALLLTHIPGPREV